MTHQRSTLSLLVVVLLGLMPMLTISAQELPASPVPGSAPTGVLAEFEIDELPTPHAEVWFLRMGLAPGGSLPPDTQIGPVLVYVESGVLTLVSDRPVTGSAAGQVATPGAGDASPVAPGFETVLPPGASAIVNEGTSLTAMNQGDAPATFLLLLMYAAEREGEVGEGTSEPVGLTQQAISVGTAEFMPAPATVTFERILVEPSGTMTGADETPEGMGRGWMGIELGAIETGSAEVIFENRTLQNMTWPGMMTGAMSRPVQVPLTGTVQLETGDGYAAFNSTLSWTATGDEPLTVLRVVVTPHQP
jgi:hypothetical protein